MARPRRPTGRARVGTITKKARSEIEGFEELTANLRRLEDRARVELLDGAVRDGSEEALAIMEQLAPKSPGSGLRGRHGADLLMIMKIFTRRDSRAAAVGISSGSDGAWWLKYAEYGTIFAVGQPFIQPTGRAMRKRMIDIIFAHWDRAVKRSLTA